MRWNPATARKLSLEADLVGHKGCVNRLAWNFTEGGTWLASGSDDTDIRLWPCTSFTDDISRRCSLRVPTQHEANIFGIQFLPYSNSSSLVTGAMDGMVQWHRIDMLPNPSEFITQIKCKEMSRRRLQSMQSGPGGQSRVYPQDVAMSPIRRDSYGARVESEEEEEDEDNDDSGDDASLIEHDLAHGTENDHGIIEQVVPTSSVVYRCHAGRVKYMEVAPGSPHLFWSAGEDGSVRQFDTRMDPALMMEYESSNVLLTATSRRHLSRRLELKAIAINPVSEHLMAVAALEPAVRVYDRRKLSPQQPSRALSAARRGEGLVLRLTPPYFALAPSGGGHAGSRRSSDRRRWWGEVYPTHVTFGNRGDKLLATFHQADAFSFDITKSTIDGRCRSAPDHSKRECSGGGGTPAALLPSLNFYKEHVEKTSFHRDMHGETAFNPSHATEAEISSSSSYGMLPPEAVELQKQGELSMMDKKYYEAVCRFTEALKIAPSSSRLLVKRAEAYLSRGWAGDAGDALADIERAFVGGEPKTFSMWLRRAQILRQCGMVQSATVIARLCHRWLDMKDEETRYLFGSAAVNGTVSSTPGDRSTKNGLSRASQDREASASSSHLHALEHHAERAMEDGNESSGTKRSFSATRSKDLLEELNNSSLLEEKEEEEEKEEGQEKREEKEQGVGAASRPFANVRELVQQDDASYSLTIGRQELHELEHHLSEALAEAEEDAQKRRRKAEENRAAARRRGFSSDPRIERGSHATSSDHQDDDDDDDGYKSDGRDDSSDENDEDDGNETIDLLAMGEDDGLQGADCQPEGMYKLDKAYAAALKQAYHPLDRRSRRALRDQERQPSCIPPASSESRSNIEDAHVDGSEIRHPWLWGALPGSSRLLSRFAGQCNQHTDIKEAVYLGPEDALVACASDDGSVFVYDAHSGQKIVRVLVHADSDVVNCLRPHPGMDVVFVLFVFLFLLSLWMGALFCYEDVHV